MRLATILVASACALLCGAGLYWLHRPVNPATKPTPVSLVETGGAAPARGVKAQTGHNQKWENLPFRASTEDGVPAARTPDGKPLAIGDFLGQYSYSAGMGGAGLLFRANGTCTNGSGACLASGSSEGIFRIVNGRVEIECLSLAGKPNGNTCLCIPVWWKGRVYILGPSGDWMPGGLAEFCNAINWGEEPRGRYDRQNLEHLFMNDPEEKDTANSSVPDEIRPWILEAPIEGQLVETADGPPKVNVGSKNGVFRGQRLLAKSESGDTSYLRVLSVEEDSCTVGKCLEWSSGPIPGPGTTVRCKAHGAGVLPPR